MLNMIETKLNENEEIGYCRWMYEKFCQLQMQRAIDYARHTNRHGWSHESFEANQAKEFMLKDRMDEYGTKLHGWEYDGAERSSYAQVYLHQKWYSQKKHSSKEE